MSTKRFSMSVFAAASLLFATVAASGCSSACDRCDDIEASIQDEIDANPNPSDPGYSADGSPCGAKPEDDVPYYAGPCASLRSCLEEEGCD